MNRITDNLSDVVIQEGLAIYQKICKDFPILDEKDMRRELLLYTLFIYIVQDLHYLGMSEKELVNEVFDQCEVSRNEYGVDEDDDE